jgi:hypothetical protein
MLTLAIVFVGARLVILGIELIIRTRRANSMGCGQGNRGRVNQG